MAIPNNRHRFPAPIHEDRQDAPGLVVTCMSDVPRPSPDTQALGESAYRRGYVQGYEQALEDMERGKRTARLRNFLSATLLPWRFTPHGGCQDFPPVIC